MLAGVELVAQRRGGATAYYLHDGLGSVRALANAASTLTDRYTYAALGALLERQGATENPYLYRGQQFDDLTGLYSLRARYYDPALGRFLSRDPFEGTLYSSRELNRYLYAANDPVNLADPSGRQILVENALLRAATGAYTGMVAGGVAGLSSALYFYALAALGACGDLAAGWALSMTPAEVMEYVAKSTLIGMMFGAPAGLIAALSPAAAAVVATAGLGRGLAQVIQQPDVRAQACLVVSMVVSVAVGGAVGGAAGGCCAPPGKVGVVLVAPNGQQITMPVSIALPGTATSPVIVYVAAISGAVAGAAGAGGSSEGGSGGSDEEGNDSGSGSSSYRPRQGFTEQESKFIDRALAGDAHLEDSTLCYGAAMCSEGEEGLDMVPTQNPPIAGSTPLRRDPSFIFQGNLYEKVQPENLKPGDLLLYYRNKAEGFPVHANRVLEVTNSIAAFFDKWARGPFGVKTLDEVLNQVPYQMRTIEVYRRSSP